MTDKLSRHGNHASLERNQIIDIAKKHLILLCRCLLLFAALGNVHAATIDTYNRDKISLNGKWRYIVDPYENGFYNYRWEKFDDQDNPSKNAFFTDSKVESASELLEYDFDHAPLIDVPSDWNTQDPRLYFYEGSVWYRTTFDMPPKKQKERFFIKFGAVNYRADVYLNGNKLGVHKGGFTPFHFEVSDVLQPGRNSLVVKVDNKRGADEVPTLNTDWWNYGGITRDVELFSLPHNFIQHFQYQLESSEEKNLRIKVKLNGEKTNNKKVQLKLPELKLSASAQADQDGWAELDLAMPTFQAWSPQNPKLYDIVITTKDDQLSDQIGFRTIETQGKNILLNGEKIFLKGISIHEEYPVNGGGRVKNKAESEDLLKKALALNANYVRLAHYPHSEHTIRLADKLGLLVWSEIPVYWTISWNKPETYRNAEQQLVEMIERDRNRASVVIWSIANETPVNDSRTKFLGKLAKKAQDLDPSRLLSAAMEKHYSDQDPNLAVVTDPLSDIVDIVSFNQYIGWYEGLAEKLERTKWHIPYDKPVIISEFGGGAVFGLHGNKDERWTEEFQADIYTKTLAMLEDIEGWAGVSPWILMDFRSPRRIHGYYQKDFNRKGLLSEKGEKKQAYYVLKDFYEKR